MSRDACEKYRNLNLFQNSLNNNTVKGIGIWPFIIFLFDICTKSGVFLSSAAFKLWGQSDFLKLWTISFSWWKVGILQMDFSRYFDLVLIVWRKQNLTWTSLKGYVIVPEGQKFSDLMRNWNWKLESQQKSPQPLSPFSFFCSPPSVAHSLCFVYISFTLWHSAVLLVLIAC